MKKSILGLLLLLAANFGYADGGARVPRSGWSFKEAGLIPVQSGGRIKPFDSYAREVVLFLTGSRTYQGWDPVDLMFSWLTFPTSWDSQPFIQVNREDVRRQLNLDEKRSRFSPVELVGNFTLMQYAERVHGRDQVTAPTGAKSKEDPREKEVKQVLERVGLFRSIVSGEGWTLIPQPAPQDPWGNIAAHGEQGRNIRTQFIAMVKGYQADSELAFKGALSRHARRSKARSRDLTTAAVMRSSPSTFITEPIRS